MKIMTKILIISVLLLLVGGIIFFLGFAANGFRFPTSFFTKDGLYVESAGEEIYKIEIDTSSEDVKIEYGDVFSVSYKDVYHREDTLYRAVTFETKGGVLKIDVLQFKLFLLSFGYPDVEIKVTVPKGRVCDISIDTVNGDINVLAQGEKIGTLDIESSNGDTKLTGVSADAILYDTTNGDLVFRGETKAKSICIEATNGEVALENGSIKSEEIKIDTTNTDVELDGGNVATDCLTYETTNGDLEIRLSGRREDYTVSYETTNGDTNIYPGGSGAKKISIHTTNGDVEVEFTEG